MREITSHFYEIRVIIIQICYNENGWYIIGSKMDEKKSFNLDFFLRKKKKIVNDRS